MQCNTTDRWTSSCRARCHTACETGDPLLLWQTAPVIVRAEPSSECHLRRAPTTPVPEKRPFIVTTCNVQTSQSSRTPKACLGALHHSRNGQKQTVLFGVFAVSISFSVHAAVDEYLSSKSFVRSAILPPWIDCYRNTLWCRALFRLSPARWYTFIEAYLHGLGADARRGLLDDTTYFRWGVQRLSEAANALAISS